MNRFRRSFWVSLVLAALLTGIVFGTGFAPATAQPQGGEERLLVKFRPGTAAAETIRTHGRHGGTVRDRIGGIDVEIIAVPAGTGRARLAAYAGDPNVLYAEPDQTAVAFGVVPNDPGFSRQWGLTRVQAPEAWAITTSAPAVKIAVLDTGIDLNHEDLASKIVASRNFTTSRTADDKYGHGTHVAGIAAAATNNGKGVSGLGWSASLLNVKVLGDTGSGNYSWVAQGIIWAADSGAKVINMSLGGPGSSQTLQDAVAYAWSKGAVLVAAAGNEGSSAPSYPAYFDNVIAVAASDSADAITGFSNYGPWVDVAAPGAGIYSTLPNHKNRLGRNYGDLSGTSMASPHVAGLAALIWSTPAGTDSLSLRERIISTADPLSGGATIGGGRINALRAVSY